MYVYIVTNKPYGTLYINVTANLLTTIWQHKTHAIPGFADTYNLETLVFWEQYEQPKDAVQRARSLKRYQRVWKIEMIDKANPPWRDLWWDLDGAAQLFGQRSSGQARG